MSRRALTETLNYEAAGVTLLEGTESDINSAGQKNLYLKGIFLEGEVRNHNQRVYPVNEIRMAVDNLNKTIRDGESILGEADHPEELNINIDRVSHQITEMWMDGPRGMGKLKILPTPMGNICRTLLENRVKLGVSSRGSGNVDSGGRVSDFEIVTVDIVAKPSAPNAYPKPIYEALRMPTRDEILVEDLALKMKYDSGAQEFLAKKLIEHINKL